MKSRMSIIGRGYLPIGKSPIFNGQKHLQLGILITPLDPVTTFLDDPLRMIRALRFHITKGFEIHESVWEAIFTPGLIDKLEEVVSQERIQGEVIKMMKHDTVSTLRLLAKIDKIEPKLLEVMFGGDIWLLPSTKK